MQECIFPIPIEDLEEKIKVCKCQYCNFVFGEITDMSEDDYSRFVDARELV